MSTDELEGLRHELVDVETAIAEGGKGSEVDALKARRFELEDQIAALQNPVGAAVDAEVVDVTAEEAEAFKPAAGELVVKPSEPESVFVVLDRHDEQQIIEEFQRRALGVMAYDFEQGGKRLVDLSYQGVNEAIRLMNNTGKCSVAIDKTAFSGRGFDEQVVVEDAGNGPEEFYVLTVYAVDARTGYGQLGTSSEPKLMRMKNGKTKWDIFARTKALNKAQRNALKSHIPEELRQTLIAMFKKDERALKEIRAGAGAAAVADLPPALTDEKAVALQARAREVYEEIRAVSKLRMLPAVFYQRLMHASSSHAELEAFVEALGQMLEETRGAAA